MIDDFDLIDWHESSNPQPPRWKLTLIATAVICAVVAGGVLWAR